MHTSLFITANKIVIQLHDFKQTATVCKCFETGQTFKLFDQKPLKYCCFYLSGLTLADEVNLSEHCM